MTEVNRVTAQNAEMYRQTEIKKLDKRHEELRLEERRVQANIKANEQARIEMNRRMNRPGQSVDRMA
jgi:ABC-type phosphate transport system auxiliary subunit